MELDKNKRTAGDLNAQISLTMLGILIFSRILNELKKRNVQIPSTGNLIASIFLISTGYRFAYYCWRSR